MKGRCDRLSKQTLRGLERLYGPGSHRCDGGSAHFEFAGLQDLIQTINQPADGVILCFEEAMLSTAALRGIIPERSDLGVFEWEKRQRDIPS